MVQNGTKWYKMVQNGTKWYKMVQNGTKWYKMVQNDTKLYKMVQNGTKWYKRVQKGTKFGLDWVPKSFNFYCQSLDFFKFQKFKTHFWWWKTKMSISQLPNSWQADNDLIFSKKNHRVLKEALSKITQSVACIIKILCS